jgi:hypothetical protein
MTGEQACVERAPLVFVVDQRLFQIPTASGHVNRFCLLQPLMALDGRRIPPGRESFPNRGRVWWMIRDDIRSDMVIPGTVWCGPIERVVRLQKDRLDTDFFQASFRQIQPGWAATVDLLEVLPVKVDDPDIALVQREIPVDWPRPTTALVLLQGQKSVLGPLRAVWKADAQKLVLSARSETQPEVLRVPVQEFFRTTRVEPFNFNLNELDSTAEPRRANMNLTRMAWLSLDELSKVGEVLDASTDGQVLAWAHRYLGFNRDRLAPLHQLRNDLSAGKLPAPAAGDAARLSRFRALVNDTARVAELGEEVARLLATTPAFAGLVREHIDAVAGERIAELIRRRQDELDAAVTAKKNELNRVRAELDLLTEEYDRRAAEAEESRQKQQAAHGEGSAERHKQADRLERAIARYQQGADRVAEDLLTLAPLLPRLGLGAGAPSATASNNGLSLPPFVHQERPARPGTPLTEEEFLYQFFRVVEERGFVFPEDDLINFHVCVKTGGLTVLAGLSGTGKSSLPRLYAEALGCRDEYLPIAVRPEWLDDRDLIGAFNPLAQRFEPASCGLVEHLIAADLDRRRGRGGIYLVCLDEMNLARVEHYFAQFLSVLELPPEARALTLFAPGLAQAADPYAPYQRLRLHDNVRFVGTVNIDETTHFFSPKVLDRCQVVAFGTPDLAAPRRERPVEILHGLQPVSWAAYEGWVRAASEPPASKAYFLSINDILKRSRLSFGFRPFDRILRYVASALPLLSEDAACDFQLKQVVLPRLRATAPAFAETLQALTEAIPRSRFPRSADILGRIAESRAEDDYFQVL